MYVQREALIRWTATALDVNSGGAPVVLERDPQARVELCSVSGGKKTEMLEDIARLSQKWQKELEGRITSWVWELLKDSFDPQGMTARESEIDRSSRLDPYKVLGLDRSASNGEIKERFNKLIRKLHPDTAGEGTEFLLQMVVTSYEMIRKERGL